MSRLREVLGSRKLLFLVVLGFASGLPYPLTGDTLKARLAAAGVAVTTIGFASWVALPYNFKFVGAPLLDRFRLPWLGRRRGWIALAQFLLAGVIAAMGFMDAGGTPAVLVAFTVGVACLSAVQDIGVDAYRTDVLSPAERGLGAASYVSGYRVAMLLAGAVAMALSETVPWRVIYWVVAGIMLMTALGTWRAPEPESPPRPPRTLSEAVVLPLVDFFRQPGAVVAILFVALYKFGDNVADVLKIKFLKDIGFTIPEIGWLNKLLGMGAVVAGAFVGGVLLPRLGTRRGLIVFGIIQAATNLLYVGLAHTGKSYAMLVVAIGVDAFCGGMGTAAFVAYMMSLCNKNFSATQYALLSSAQTILSRTIGGWSGYWTEAWGWSSFYAASTAAAIPGLLLLALFLKIREEPPDAPAPQPR